MNFNYKLGGAVAIATFVASVLAPAGLADTNINVTNNGVSSNNTVTVKGSSNDNAGVSQTNNTTVSNGVTVHQNTGNNKTNFNTGGDNGIVTGDANSDVNITVGGSTNVATGSECGCSVANTNINIIDNGASSKNKVTVNNGNGGKNNKNNGSQKNTSVIVNSVDVHQVTGKNKAKYNTGGSNGIITGNSTSNVTINVTGSANTN